MFDKIHKDIKKVAAINWIEEAVLLWSSQGNARVTIRRPFEDVELIEGKEERSVPSPIAKIEELYSEIKSLTIDPESLHSREIMGEQRAYEKVLKILEEEEELILDPIAKIKEICDIWREILST